MNVIIADDDVVRRKKLRKVLDDHNFNVVDEAVNGLHAYNQYVAHAPDLILLSMKMPIFNSLDTIGRILDYNSKAMIVVMSEQNQNKIVFEALECGAVHYFTLPYDVEKVIAVINEIDDMLKERSKYV